jgi:hypothetical protein
MKRILAVAAIALVTLAGCAAPAEPPSPSASSTPIVTPTPSATPSVTPSPSASPSPTQTAAAAECPTWSDDPDETAAAIGPISFAGVCVGQTFDEAIATGAPLNAPEMCPWAGELVAIDDPGFYVFAYSDVDTPGEYIRYFVMHWFGDPADAASYEVPRTPEGITIGSTVAEVSAAYPDATEVTFEDIARGTRTQLVVRTTPTTTYNFDVFEGVVNEVSWGENIGEGGPNGDQCAL